MKSLIVYFCLIFITYIDGFAAYVFPGKRIKCIEIMAPTYQGVEAGKTVEFEGKQYPHLEYDHFKNNFGAYYIRPSGDRIQNLSKVKKYVILLHGVGADYSNPNSMIHQYGNYTGTSGFDADGKESVSYGKK